MRVLSTIKGNESSLGVINLKRDLFNDRIKKISRFSKNIYTI